MLNRCLISSAIFVVAVAALSAQPSKSSDADTQELKSYTLTVPALKQFVTATRNMMSAIKADPRYTETAALEAEIAELLGISRGNVARVLHDARRQLATTLTGVHQEVLS